MCGGACEQGVLSERMCVSVKRVGGGLVGGCWGAHSCEERSK